MPKPQDPTQPPPTQPPPPTPISSRQRRREEREVKALVARQEKAQTLGFCVRDFVLCALPLRRTKEPEYERKNGDFLFRVEASRRYGMPFGQDRLIPIWLATAFQAVGKPEDNTIRFRSASDILRAFDQEPGGKQRRELRGRIQRIFGATYFVDDPHHPRGIFAEGYRLIRRVSLWFDRDERVNQHTLWQNEITLSADFANDLRLLSLPIDMETVRALKESPAALDLYAWQAWRSYRLLLSHQRQPQRVPISAEDGGLLEHLGSSAAEAYKARQLLRRWQALVHQHWKDCPNRLSDDGKYFLVYPARALALSAKIELPGVRRNPPPMRKTPTGERLLLVDDDKTKTKDDPTPQS